LTRWASVGQNLYKQDARNDLRILKSRQTAAGASMAGLDRVVEEAEADLDERELASPVLSPITEEQIEDESGDIPLKVSPALVHPIKADILRRKSFEWSWRLFIIRALRRFGKGFLIGYGGRAAFSLLPVIIKARLNPFKIWSAFRASAFKHISFGLFLGTFLSVFESLMKVLYHWRKQWGLQPSTRALTSGAVAAISLAFLPKESRSTIMVFFFVRALEIAARWLSQTKRIPSIPHPEAAVMSLASAQVLWTWLVQRRGMDATYVRFLDVHGAQPKPIREALAHLLQNAPVPSSLIPPLSPYLPGRAVWLPRGRLHDQFCSLLHPQTSSCTLATLQFFIKGLRRALPVYLPVYLLPLIIFNRKRLFNDPVGTLRHTAVGIARSSAFLSSYCAVAWATTCFFRQALGHSGSLNVNAAGLVAGLTVLLEHPSRRIELALYVLSHALHAAHYNLRHRGLLPAIPFGEIALFMASMAIIMQAYINHPSLMRRSYVGLLSFFFGSGRRERSFGRHQRLPSVSLPASAVPPKSDLSSIDDSSDSDSHSLNSA